MRLPLLPLLALLACRQERAPVLPFLPVDSGGSGDSGGADASGVLGLVQIDLDGWIGEAMLVVGPDGTRVLIDVGNDSHADVIGEAVRAYTGADAVDAVVLTHFHEDHAGGMDKLQVDVDLVVSRGPVHLDATGWPDGLDGRTRLDLCDGDGCDLPWTLPLGQGAELVVFAADGQLDALSTDTLPDDDDGENGRSLVGLVRWGSFVYLWSGDLTGGGKGTPDVEGTYLAGLDAYVPSDGVTILHLAHHGIDSSTSEAWVDRLLPSDGEDRAALVGSNGSYLDAPADEVLDRVRDRVTAVWTNRGGLLTGDDPILREAEGDVVVTVREGGAAVEISGGAFVEQLQAR
jgi:beta-lactamase superfamily II metal-dependent hydrolase